MGKCIAIGSGRRTERPGASTFLTRKQSDSRWDKFENIMKYLRWKTESRVCIIYGLRRTGKTTMLMQAAADLTEEEFAKAFYIKASVRTSADNPRSLGNT